MDHMDKNLSCEQRAQALLSVMSVDEKLWQLSADMIFDVGQGYDERREPRHGHYRNPGHFMHAGKEKPATPAEVARRINRDVELSIAAQPHGIPPIENGEALHGAQWGMATCFPQPIGMASTFDDELMGKVADVIGMECAAVGVRHVFAPVINITRDCRWGRTVETFGEDVLLSSNMGYEMCKGLEKNGVIATPKHFVDNYAAGGRDSNYSDTSERTLREVFLRPFEKCFKGGVAHSVMPAYNAWDGLPCSCNRKLLTGILRNEWGFDGFAVSDYGAMNCAYNAHKIAEDLPEVQAMCIKAGLEVSLAGSSIDSLRTAYARGSLTDADLDKAVFNILKMKFAFGIFDSPFADPDKADDIVRCAEHKQLALEAAREAMILLKNDGVLPLKKENTRRIGVFGASADVLPVGLNYSGSYQAPWTAEDAKTPLQYLREYLGNAAEVVFAPDSDIEKIAPGCDACLYFTTIVEGEGMDRCSITLPKLAHKAKQADENAQIVGKIEFDIRDDQDDSILRLAAANPATAVVLLNGAPVDMSAWIDSVGAVIEAWYPGEQGAQAIAETVFGEISPSAKLPITIPRCVGQLPLFYAYKPSGRGYGYNDNDGTPLYPFGYGLSYTEFEVANVSAELKGDSMAVAFDIENTGTYDGAEVMQVYLSGSNCDVVMPVKELKAYNRVNLKAGENARVCMELDAEAFSYFDQELAFGMHNGDHTVMLGNSSSNIMWETAVKVRGGKLMQG